MKLRFLALAALLFAACENFGEGILGGGDNAIPESITATLCDVSGTRLTLSGVEHHFDMAESAALFFDNAAPQRWVYVGDAGQKSGLFYPKVRPEDDAKRSLPKAVMVYPYDEGISIDADNQTLSVELPATQSYTPNSYDPNTSLMVGLSDSDNFELKSVYGWYKISAAYFAGSNGDSVIETITLRAYNGEQLSGKATYNYSTGAFEFVSTEGGDTITLTGCSNAVRDDADNADYYIALAPQTYTAGFDIECLLTDGSTVKLPYNGEVTIESNCITVARDNEEWESRGIAIYSDDFLAPIYGQDAGNIVKVEIEESTLRPGMYRLVNLFTQENVKKIIGGAPSDMTYAEDDVYIEIDARNPEEVIIYHQPTGMYISGLGNVEIATLTNSSTGETAYGKLEDGIISFPINALGFVVDATILSYANRDGLFRIMFEGHEVYMFASYGGEQFVVEEYASVFDFECGAAVSEYRYAIVEGDAPLTHTESDTPFGGGQVVYHDAILELIDCSFSGNYVSGIKPASEKQLYVSGLATGVYTLFALPCNSNGEPSILDLKRIVFYFRGDATDDEVPVLEPEILFGSVAEVIGYPDYEQFYPSSTCLYIVISIESPYYNFIEEISYVCKESVVIEEYLASGYTYEQILTMLDHEVVTSDTDGMRKNGDDGRIFENLTPDTSYTVVLSITTDYGTTQYFSATASTTPL